eukprot:gene4396-5406_t
MSSFTAASNSASSGGAMSAVAGSRLELSHGDIEGNSAILEGGGISASASVVHVILQSYLAKNTAGQTGGGIALLSGSDLHMENATVAHNRASEGGGLWVDHIACAHITFSVFFGNVAQEEADGGVFAEFGSGGAVAAASDVGELRLDNCLLVSNEAHRGAGVFVHTPSELPAVQLSNLHFDQNLAFVGPNVMWEYAATAATPACFNCTRTPTADALMSSSAVRFAVMQRGAEVGATLWADSDAVIDPGLTYTAIDFYGNVTSLSLRTSDNSPQEPTVVAVALANTSSLTGSTVALYTYPYGATFEALAMVGLPGESFNLSFQPQADGWGDVSVTVMLAPCEAGTQHIEQGQSCERCASGLLKFDNSTQPCSSTDCSAVDGITCPGGAEYSLDDGYWLAAESVRKCVLDAGADSVGCVFDRVYVCDFSGACDSEDGRSNTAGEPAIAQALMCAEGYRSDTALCEIGRQILDAKSSSLRKSFIRVSHIKIIKGHDASALLSTLLNHMQAVPPAPAPAAWALLRPCDMRDLSEDYFADSVLIMVMSQHTLIFPIEAFPKIYYDYVANVFSGVFNVSLVRWLGLQCLVAGSISGPSFADSVGVGLFYFNFLIIAALPYVILLPVFVSLLLGRSRGKGASHDLAEGLDSAGEDLPAEVLHGTEHRQDSEWSVEDRPLTLEKQVNVAVTMVEMAAEQQSCETDTMAAAQAREAQRYVDMAVAAKEVQEHQQEEVTIMRYNVNEMNITIMAAAVMTKTGEQNSEMFMAAASKAEEENDGIPAIDQVAGEQRHIQVDTAARAASANAEAEIEHGDVQMAAAMMTTNAAAEQSRELNTVMVAERAAHVHHKQGDTSEVAAEADELRGDAGTPAVDGAETNMLVAYSVFAMLCLIYIHPMVSTACFQVFYCDAIHFDQETVQYWLHADRSSECFTPGWFVFMSVSIFVIFTFSLGLPISLSFGLRYLHAQKQVTLNQLPLFVRASQIHVSYKMSHERTYKIPHPTTGALVVVEPVFRDGATGDELDRIRSRLDTKEVLLYAAPYTEPFKEPYFYFLGITILIRLMQTSVVVLIRMALEHHDTIYALTMGHSYLDARPSTFGFQSHLMLPTDQP